MAVLVLLALLALPSPLTATAQEATALSDQQRLLELKASWVEMRRAESERNRTRQLREMGLASDAESTTAEAAYQVAQVAYQQRFLELFSATPRVSVERCLKSYETESRQFVDVTLRNSSAPAIDYRAVGIVDDEVPMPDLDRLSEVQNVFVSLTDADGTVIALPYEQRISRIAANAATSIRFRLLNDLDSVQVALRYAGRRETLPVYLEKDAAANVVRLSSRQFSQEADLGGSAIFDLRLERYGQIDHVYGLRVFGLPEEVGIEMVDPGSGARLSQIKFTEGAHSQQLRARVFLPDVVSDLVQLDQPTEFWIAALSQDVLESLPDGRTIDASELERIRSNTVRLELVPRGIGKLAVTAPSLFEEISRDQSTSLEITLRNIGTRRVDNIRLNGDAPPDWQVTIDPPSVARLEPNQEARVTVSLSPPANVQVGDYPIRLNTEAYTDNRRIESENQTARIHVVAPPNLFVIGLLALAVIAIIGGLVAWGVHVTRR